MKRKRFGVVVVTYGEVEKLSIGSLWPNSRRILRVVTSQIARIPSFLVNIIADYRSLKHYLDWRLSGYRSPLNRINRSQAEQLRQALVATGDSLLSAIDLDVLDACYFMPPYFEDMLASLKQRYDGIVVVPMIPVESAFSCGIACQLVSDVFGQERYSQVRVMSRLWKDPVLQKMYLDHLFSQLSSSMTARGGGKAGLVLVIHGTLVRDRSGNPPEVFTGLEETQQFFEVMRGLILSDPRNPFDEVRQGCMNHRRGGEWTAETIEKAIDDFRREGYSRVAMFPYGFFADNSETEYIARRELEHGGFARTQYVPCLNASEPFARWLSGRVLDELRVLDGIQKAFATL